MNVKDKFSYEDWLYITDDKDRVICKVSHNLVELHVEEYAANAKLIAAAPELLEALKLIANTSSDAPEAMKVIAKQAIKKATL
jgi:hypothetical protein